MEPFPARLLVGCALLFGTGSTVSAITVTPAAGPGDATNFANVLVDAGSAITVNSATFLIDVVGGGTAQSEVRAIGLFANGNAGGQLPAINQLDPQNPVSYASGIGLSTGVCLCTGLVTDADTAANSAVAGSGVGIQGPNNGFPITALDGPPLPGETPLNAGELSFRTDTPRDQDFAAVKTVDPVEEGDATVLQFQITISSPGFLRISPSYSPSV